MRGIEAIKILARARGLLFDSAGVPAELDSIHGTALEEVGHAGGLSLVASRCLLSALAAADLPAIARFADGGYVVIDVATADSVLLTTTESESPDIVDVGQLASVWTDMLWMPGSEHVGNATEQPLFEDRPTSRRIGRIIGWSVLVMALVMVFAGMSVVAWMGLQPVDTEFVAIGRMVPDPAPASLVAPASGVLRSLSLTEGKAVQAGEVIGEIDSVVPINPDHERADIAEAAVGAARASALLAALNADAPPVLREVPDLDPVRRAIEQQHLIARFEDYRGKIAAINAEAEQRRVERVAAEELAARTADALEAIRKQVAEMRPLLEQGIISRNSFLEKDARRTELERELGRHREFVVERARAMEGLEARRRSIRSELERTLYVERDEFAKLLAQLRKPAPPQTRMVTIVAPLDGIVRRIAPLEVGKPIKQGEEVAGIAPPTPPLELEVITDAAEAFRVKPGQIGRATLTVPMAGSPELAVRVASVAEHATGPAPRQRSTRIRLLTEKLSGSSGALAYDSQATWQVRLQTGAEMMMDRWIRQWQER